MPGPTEELPQFDEKKSYAIQEDTFVSRNNLELSHVTLNQFQV